MSNKNKKSSFFWVSYSDLMTTLFFVMLVLFVLSFQVVKIQLEELKISRDSLVATNNLLEEIRTVEEALETLDQKYFTFDRDNKRYKLAIDVNFNPDSHSINDISNSKLDELEKAGRELYNKVKSIISENPKVNYLLVIEGNAQRVNNNWVRNPTGGYYLSYRRALALFNFWEEKGIDFSKLGNSQCEVIIAGSGYFGLSREEDRSKNRRFTIQITSKVGMFLNQSSDDS